MVPPPPNGDATIQAWVTGATNLAMLPVIVQAFSYELYYEGLIGIMTMVTSSTYHVAQSLDLEPLGFNEGRWHHMDNVFAIASLMAIIVGYAQLRRTSGLRELLNAGSLSLAVVAQLMSPWDVIYTIGPLVAALVSLVLIVVIRQRLPSLDRRTGRASLMFLAGAVLCFIKGLDDRKDWLRLWHGGWHLFIGGFCFYAVRSQKLSKRAEVALFKDA